MKTAILLTLWVSVLGCGGGSPNAFDDAPRPDSAASDDPFLEGNSYRFAMTTKATPGLKKESQVAVRVFIREFVSKGPVNHSNRLSEGAEVQLNWVCGDEQQRGHEKIKMNRLNERLDVSLKKLPALKRITDSVKCTIKATLDTTGADGERVIVSGSHDFYIEMSARHPALQLHGVEIADNAIVSFKVTLIRQGKAVVKGDNILDNEIDVELTWICNDDPSVEKRSKSDSPASLKIDKGKAEVAAQLNLPDTILGKGGYACMITAVADVDGYEHVEGKKKVWVEGKDLQVAVTSVSNTSLSYAVTKRYQHLDGNVRLSLDNCGGVTITADNVASQGSVVLSGSNSGNECKLKAELVTSGTVSRKGVSNEFSVPSALRQSRLENI